MSASMHSSLSDFRNYSSHVTTEELSELNFETSKTELQKENDETVKRAFRCMGGKNTSVSSPIPIKPGPRDSLCGRGAT